MIMPATIVRLHTRCRYIMMTSLRPPRHTQLGNITRVLASRIRAIKREKPANHQVLVQRLNETMSRVATGSFKTKDLFASV